eukprot:2068772-Alexandrium_andersonii.AAC.1
MASRHSLRVQPHNSCTFSLCETARSCFACNKLPKLSCEAVRSRFACNKLHCSRNVHCLDTCPAIVHSGVSAFCCVKLLEADLCAINCSKLCCENCSKLLCAQETALFKKCALIEGLVPVLHWAEGIHDARQGLFHIQVDGPVPSDQENHAEQHHLCAGHASVGRRTAYKTESPCNTQQLHTPTPNTKPNT